MRCTLALLLLGLVSSACDPDPYPLHGDVTFTTEERAAIEAGARFLSDHTTNESPIVIIWDAPHVDGACDRTTIQRNTILAGGVHHAPEQCIEIGTKNEDLAWLVPLSAHEFGHWRMGSAHVEHGLMQPVGCSLEWTDEDQALCVAQGMC